MSGSLLSNGHGHRDINPNVSKTVISDRTENGSYTFDIRTEIMSHALRHQFQNIALQIDFEQNIPVIENIFELRDRILKDICCVRFFEPRGLISYISITAYIVWIGTVQGQN